MSAPLTSTGQTYHVDMLKASPNVCAQCVVVSGTGGEPVWRGGGDVWIAVIADPVGPFTLHASVDGWGLFDVSMCFPGLYHKGHFIGQCIRVYLHNARLDPSSGRKYK